MKLAQVYILKCNDKSLYTGVTSNLEFRLADHQEGRFLGYTHMRRPVQLMWNTDMIDIQDAIMLERQIKRWGRKKKLSLINDDWQALHLLAECQNESHHGYLSLDSARDDHLDSIGDDHLNSIGDDHLNSIGDDHLDSIGDDHLDSIGDDHLNSIGDDEKK
ncbi:GIY-YIG nuclease family protein [bacterium]|nr:GIY-YIG nuclease family protein [bacterium]